MVSSILLFLENGSVGGSSPPPPPPLLLLLEMPTYVNSSPGLDPSGGDTKTDALTTEAVTNLRTIGWCHQSFYSSKTVASAVVAHHLPPHFLLLATYLFPLPPTQLTLDPSPPLTHKPTPTSQSLNVIDHNFGLTFHRFLLLELKHNTGFSKLTPSHITTTNTAISSMIMYHLSLFDPSPRLHTAPTACELQNKKIQRVVWRIDLTVVSCQLKNRAAVGIY